MSRIRYSIVIPAFNEENRISATLDQILKFFAERGTKGEIVVVDDGSTDSTADIVQRYRRRTYRTKLFRLQHRGKGWAVRHGVRHAHGEFVFLCDADLNNGVAELEKLETALMRGADVAIGSRWVGSSESVRSQPFYRRVSGRFFNFLTQRLLGLEFKDTQCGLKAFTREAAHALFPHQSVSGWGFDPELLFLAQRMGFRVEEVGIELHHDYETSRFRPVRDGARAFAELFRIFARDFAGYYPRPVPVTTTTTVPSEITPLAAESTREAA